MNKYYIYFFGLMAHVGNENSAAKDFAAIVRDNEHTPFVRWERGGEKISRNATRVEFRSDGKPIVSHAFTDRHFDRFVPSVRQIMGGSLQPQQVLDGEVTVVRYPPTRDDRPGILGVGELYPLLGRHRIGGNIRRDYECVARLTVLPIESSASKLEIVEIVVDKPPRILHTMYPNECIVIGNVSSDADEILFTAAPQGNGDDAHHAHHGGKAHVAHASGDHFRRYGNILNGENNIITVDEGAACTHVNEFPLECPWVKWFMKNLTRAGIRTPNHLECGNSAYP